MSTRIVHDCATGEIEEVQIPAKELKALTDAFNEDQAGKAELAAKRQQVLDKLGLTAEEAAYIL
jgi:hypothetical protein